MRHKEKSLNWKPNMERGRAGFLIHQTPPLSPATSTCENPSSCRWRPYYNSNTKDFEANAIITLIVLVCALISVVAFNVAIRCFLRGGHRQAEGLQPKPNLKAAEASLVVMPTAFFSTEMEVTECAICLSEYVEGEGVHVLGICKHCFHVQCIQLWLSSHSSCPTCRRCCFPPPPPSTSSDHNNNIPYSSAYNL